jgi:hypothetical protein
MEIDCVQRNNTFKFKVTLDRHNPRLKLIYCLLPDPPRFSLPSTFKKDKALREGVGEKNSETFCQVPLMKGFMLAVNLLLSTPKFQGANRGSVFLTIYIHLPVCMCS